MVEKEMNVQEAVKQTLDIYSDSDEYQSIDNAMDYLLQVLKIDDEKRIKKAVYEAKHPKTEISDPYMSGYRCGWNDGLDEIIKRLPIGLVWNDVIQIQKGLKKP